MSGWRAAVFAVLCAVASAGWAHDSWLSPSRHAAAPGQLLLELGTGNRFPVQEFSSSPQSVVHSGCVGRGGKLPLRPVREQPNWLELAAASASPGRPAACWLELAEAYVELEPRLVEVYFAEIRATAAQREAWAGLQARHIPWRETYRKFARIELASVSAASPGERETARRPAGLDLEIVVLGDQPIATGQPLAFQVLRDGQPLAGFPVELVSERSPLGIWRTTDAQGTLRHSLPFAGRWLLRGTDLRLSTKQPTAWESRFVTLAIEAR